MFLRFIMIVRDDYEWLRTKIPRVMVCLRVDACIVVLRDGMSPRIFACVMEWLRVAKDVRQLGLSV